ncbi:MAG TPA: pseudouridine synthase [Bacillota bacterium]|nr:pseudouridine synthase [Bacillota bacterium]
MAERLQKYLAAAGVASRRASEALINDGRVTVNGEIASLGLSVHPGDVVLLDGKPVALEEKVYYMLNKPAGYTTTVSDPHAERTVMELMEDIPVRIFPVGRLDKDTEGLLLFTNDGELANKLMHPAHRVSKTYLVRVMGRLQAASVGRLQRGLDLTDGRTSPAKLDKLVPLVGETEFELTIWEGRNRQVRRMCLAVGHEVTFLKRLRVGNLTLGNLPLGHYKKLRQADFVALAEGGDKQND